MQNFNNSPYYNGPYGYNSPYGYSNPYGQPKLNNGLIFVNGIEGAKSYQMQPNQMVMLLDSDNPIIYKKTSNGYGQSTVECFKMVQVSEEELKGTNNNPNQEYVLKADFDALVKRMDELTKSKESK